jgi:cell division protein FtsB
MAALKYDGDGGHDEQFEPPRLKWVPQFTPTISLGSLIAALPTLGLLIWWGASQQFGLTAERGDRQSAVTEERNARVAAMAMVSVQTDRKLTKLADQNNGLSQQVSGLNDQVKDLQSSLNTMHDLVSQIVTQAAQHRYDQEHPGK